MKTRDLILSIGNNTYQNHLLDVSDRVFKEDEFERLLNALSLNKSIKKIKLKGFILSVESIVQEEKQAAKEIEKEEEEEEDCIPVFDAILEEDVEKLALFINENNINTKFLDGRTALFFAVEQQKIAHVRYLLQKGANVNLADDRGTSPLFAGIHKENINIIQLLLNAGADPSQKDEEGDSPQSYIQFIGDEKIKKLIIACMPVAKLYYDKKAYLEKIDCSEDVDDLLKEMEEDNYTDFEERILEGADVNANYDGLSILHYTTPLPKYLNKLLKYRANPNAWSSKDLCTVLEKACLEGNVNSVVTLLDHGANPNLFGLASPITCAAIKRHLPIIQTLIAYEAEVNMPENIIPPICALFYESYSPKILNCLDALLDAGANINDTDINGLSSLILAILNHYPIETIQALLEHGANACQTIHGNNSLHVAVRFNNAPAVKLLIEHVNCMLTRDSFGKTALDIATELRLDEISKILKDKIEKSKITAPEANGEMKYTDLTLLDKLGDESKDPLESLLILARKADINALVEMNKLQDSKEVWQAKSLVISFYVKESFAGKQNFQILLGKIYEKGLYIGVNISLAKFWYGIASKNGFIEASLALGDIYQCDYDMTDSANIQLAIETYKKISDHPEALYKLSKCVQDEKLKIEYRSKAAEKGHSIAQYELGMEFYEKDSDKAISWLDQSARKGNKQALQQLGLIYFNKSNYIMSFKLCLEAAQENQIESIYILAILILDEHIKGEEIDSNDLKKLSTFGEESKVVTFLPTKPENIIAIKLLIKAAAKGHGDSQCKLALMLSGDKKNLVAIDYKQALNFYMESAERGNAQAQYELGLIFRYDYKIYGIAQNCKQAYEWFLQSAKQGYGRAECEMGLIYENGLRNLIEVDVNQAAKWYRSAADKKVPIALCNLGQMYRHGNAIISKDLRQTVLCFNEAADAGCIEAVHNLAELYRDGLGVAQNNPKAAELYLRAAKSGFAHSQFHLGWMYEKRLIEPSLPPQKPTNKRCLSRFFNYLTTASTNANDLSMNEAVKWYKEAAKTLPEAAEALADLYASKFGSKLGECKESIFYLNEAIKLIKPKADAGDSDAQVKLGTLHYNIKEYKSAIEYYKKASEQNNSESFYHLGWMYHHGEGVGKNFEEAVTNYGVASQLGYAPAKEALDQLNIKIPKP